MNAERLIQEYSGMDESEQIKFNRMHKRLMNFKSGLDILADKISKMSDAEVKAALERIKK